MRAVVSSGEGDGFVEAVAGAWEAGLGLRFEGLHAGEARRRLSLPTYPFERQRYWVEGLGRRRAAGGHPLLGERRDSPGGGITFEREMSASDPQWLDDHRVFGRITAPAALHAALATTAIARVAGAVGVALEAFRIHAPLVFDDADDTHPDRGWRTLQVVLDPAGEDGMRSVEIHSRGEEGDSWLRHAEGRVVAGPGDDEGGGAALDVEALKTELTPLPAAALHERMAAGVEYGPLLRVVESVWSGDGEALVEVALPAGVEVDDATAAVVLLDGCFQAPAAVMGEAGSGEVWLPSGWDRLWLAGALPERVLCHVRLVEAGGEAASGVRMASLGLYSVDGSPVGGARGVVLARTTRAALLSSSAGVEELLYDVVWRERALPGGLRPADFLATPGAVAGRATDVATHLAAEGVEIGAMRQFLAGLDLLARDHALAALEGLGWRREPAAPVRPAELRRSLRVVAEHERLLHRLFEMLEEGGILERSPEGLVVARTGDADRASSDPGDLPDTLLERHPWGAAELGLVERCGAALGDVLRGRAEPLELLSGGGSSGAAALRHESPIVQAMHRVVGDAVEALVEALPEKRRLRVLAIGAGGAREAIRAALPEGRAACLYAEASGDILADRFAVSSGSRVLDLERDPVAQGFEAHGHDVVIAANVLHATRDLGEALGHLRALLAPSGTLVALEGLRRQGWLDLTFGLLDGWWRHADEYRTDGALVGEAVWRLALSDAGYGEVAVLSSGPEATLGVIVARGPAEVVEPEGLWLVAADRGDVGGRLAEALAARNQRVVVAGEAVSWSGGEALPGVRVAHVEPGRREAWRSLVEELAGDGTLRGVVHLSGLDGSGGEATAEALGEDAEHGYASALALTQGLLDADIAPAAGVWFVTRGAQMVSREQGGVLAGAALWGLSRTVEREAPRLGARLVDLDPESGPDVDALAGELLYPDRETQVAHRAGVRHAVRLVRGVMPDGPALPELSGERLRGDGTYLVTGGLGGIGREVAAWLASRGAGAIVLNGRRPPGPEAEAVIEALRSRGVTVEVELADVSDGEAVEAMLGRIGERLPPLAGVIHGAGALADGALANQDRERFARVMAPKMLGAWHLHRATRESGLDLFVLFSSAAGVLGNVGQASYAAANAFLDRLAGHRRSLGLAGQAIAWGAWSGAGMAEGRRERPAERLRAAGQGWLSPAQGLGALDHLVEHGAVTGMVAVADWPVLAGRMASVPAFLDEVLPAIPDRTSETVAPAGLLSRLRGVPEADRERVLVDFLQDELQAVLRLPEPPAPPVGFFDLGMDSLMAVELRNRLNVALRGVCTLSGTVVFDYPNIRSLARHLAGELGMLGEAPPPARRPAPLPAEDSRIAIVGMACRFPGGADLASFWDQLAAGRDAVAEVSEGQARPGGEIGARSFEAAADGSAGSRWGAYIEGVDRFDASFFRIAPVEARLLDPQQRLLLETSWEALEEAGIDPEVLKGSRAGVFAGISSSEYRELLSADGAEVSTLYAATGTSHSTAIGRVAFTLGLEGPAIAVDTACSSSLVALHQAVMSLQRGESDLALAGGVNAILSPVLTEIMVNAGMLAPDGRCKTFDAAADGFVRGEGCAMVVLKRLSDAEAAGDRIWAVVRGSAVNQDGASAGLTVPSGPAQERVIAEALSRAGLEPSEVDYLEAHGTGTELGDPVEAHAAAAAYGRGRAVDRPLLIGSVKTNVGHLDAAAGVAGLVKVVLSMHHGVIPRHLHYETPSPRMDWARLPLRVTSEATPWPEVDRPVRAAGVSSFGYSGTNAHVVLESPGVPGEGAGEASPVRPVGAMPGAYSAPAAYSLRGRPVGAAHLVGAWWVEGEVSPVAEAPSPAGARLPAGHATASDTTRSGSRARSIQGEDSSVALMAPEARDIEPRVRRLLALSARSDAALRAQATRYIAWLDGDEQSGPAEDASGMDALLADMAWTAGVGRSRFEHRAGVVFGGVEELRGGLERLAAEGGRGAGGATRVAFLFTGQGSQWAGMGRALYRREPVVRAVLERCEREMVSLRGESLLDVMFGREGAAGSVDDTTWTQPALYALGCALSALWESVGVRPVAVLGHSVGELAAAHVAGVYGLEEGLRLASVRGELMGGLPSDAGAMTAVFASAERVEALIEESGAEGVEVAADNGTHRVVSGLVEGVEALEGWCVKAGVRCGRLVTSHAFHSALMEPVLDGIEAAAGDIEVRSPVVSLVSNVTGRVVGEGELLDGAYWRRHARAPVAYGPGVGALSGLGVDVVIELGPGSVLGPLLAQTWPTGDVPVVLASQRRALASGHRDAEPADESADGPGAVVSSEEGDGFVEAVSGAWEAGLGLRFEGLHAGELRRRLSLPTYPFERERYWVEVEGLGRRRAVGGHPLLGLRHDLPDGGIAFERELSVSEPGWLGEHRVFGRVLAPGALHAVLAGAVRVAAGGSGGGVVFDGFQMHAPLVLEELDETDESHESHPQRGVRSLQVLVGAVEGDGSRRLEVYSRGVGEEAWLRHAEGRVGAGSAEGEGGAALDVEGLKGALAPVPSGSLYEAMGEAGIGYGPRFRVVGSVWSGEGEALVEVSSGEGSGDGWSSVMVLDGCFQALAAATGGGGSGGTWLPFGWERLWLSGPLPGRLLCHARLLEGGGESASDVRTAELGLYAEDGASIGGVRGFVLRRATRAALLSAVTGVEGLLYDVVWRERALAGGLRSAEFLVSPGEVADGAEDLAVHLAAEGVEADATADFLGDIERLARSYALEALEGLGWRREAGAVVRPSELRRALKVVAEHERLLDRLFGLLEEGGVLERSSEGLVVSEAGEASGARSETGDVSNPGELLEAMRERYPFGGVELGLLGRCGAALCDVLRGRVEGLELLFGAEGGGAESLYHEAPLLRAMNRQVGEVVSGLVGGVPAGRRLRVLEVGAGTGGTTGAVLGALPAGGYEYTYTDISAGFFAGAEGRFGGEGASLVYRVLDIERDPVGQGFEAHGYDVVVAANVLHATRDLGEALEHCRALLAPSGVLVCLEGLRSQGWLDLTFGLLEGWWRYGDGYRTDGALVGEGVWRRALGEAGYGEVSVVSSGSGATQGVIVARGPSEVVEPEGLWLLASDRGETGRRLAAGLVERNQRVVVAGEDIAWPTGEAPPGVRVAHVEPQRREAWRSLVEGLVGEGALRGVVHLTGLDGGGEEATSEGLTSEGLLGEVAHGSGSALALVQGLLDADVAPAGGVWLVTRGAQSLGRERGGVLSGAALWGLGRTVGLEAPGLGARLVDLDPGTEADIGALVDELLSPDRETQVAHRGGVRHGARLVRGAASGGLSVPGDGPWRLVPDRGGLLEGLRAEAVSGVVLGAGEVRVAVDAAGLNFHDVLIAMQVVDAQSPLGGELSGRVVETGPGVARVSVGERVVGLAGGAFGTHVVTREELLWPVPAGMGASAAATVPVVYVTVALAFELAGVKAGERVLVHAAAGGVGHAAIALARRLGAEVVATASEAKRAHVRSLGVTHVFDSRTTGFARGVLEATGGAGVDVVLNSLTGAGFVEASLECLREGGRFVELGKRDIWSEEAMRGVRPDVGYRVLAVDEWLEDAEGRVRVGAAFGEVMAGLSGGELAALPFDAWPLVEAGGAMRWMGSGRHVGKVVLRAPGVVGGRLRGEGTYLVTGGLGGIGREVAEWLAERGAGAIVLNGRRPPAPEVEAALEALRARGVRVEVEIADVSDGEAVEAMLGRIAERLPPLAGVIHSVGVLSDAALANQDWGRFERVLGPKMVGAWHLHRATRDLELDLFVLFTSVAGVLGNAGQANHAAANAFLDRLAQHRRALGLAGQAVAWGAWSGTGEAEEQRGRIEERMRAAGQGWLTPVQGLQALDRVVERDAAAAVVTAVEWSVLGGRLTSIPAFLEEVVSSEGAASREAEAAGGDGLVSRLRRVVEAEREAVLVEFVQDELQEVLRLAERPSSTVGFFDLGMDSLMAVELRNRLSRALTGVCTVSGTAVFDHPDAQRLGRHLAGELGMLGEGPVLVSAPVRAPASAAVAVEDARVAIVGMACRFPGGADLASFWEQLEAGRDAVAAVPRGQARPGGRPVRGGGVHPEPATVREPASAVAQGASGRFANAGRPLRSSPRRRESTRAEAAEELPYKAVADDSAGSRWGAYIEDIDRFDAPFFRIAPVEARLLDPQQRLLLETSWEALEEAGIDPAGLRGSRTGVFAGISSNDYQEYVSPGGGSDVLTLYTATGSSHSAAIGRIAFTLGLEGPAIAVDTACSSSLVALHQAVVSLQRGESDLALAGGVHAILSPMATEIFVKAGMLSPDGRCKTFDAAADGFVRGEGCAMVVLKRLSDAEAAGDRIWAVVRGSAVNQDGASAGLTVPSGPAQERVIGEALSRAGLAPSEVDYLEAHGTGTELGDPVEAHAAAAAYGRGRAADRPLLIGTVKTNVGHLEAAAGVAGLVKTVLAMHHGMIPRHLHYETPSPRMDWTRLPLRVVSEAVPWPVVDRPMRAGVSSFGFSGTNAHVILESHGLPGDEGAGAGAVRPVGAATGAVAGAYSLRGRPVGAAHLVGTWRAEGEGSPEMDAPAPAGARLPAGQATAADTTRSGSRAQSIQSEDSSSTLPAPEARDIEPRVRRVLALSARSDAALRGLATRYLAWLDGQVGQVGEDGPAGEDGQAGPARDDAEQAARDGQAGEDGQAGRHGQTGDSAEPAGQEGQPGPAGHDAGMDALLADMAWTAGVGRSRFEHRAGVVFGGVEELRGGLERLAAEGGRGAGGATRVAFLFTGQGSQWAGMGRALYRREPVVRAVLERCEREMVSLRGESLLDVMFGREGAAGSVDDTTWTQPALYALGCALSALWESVGVRPVAVLGHSVGELAAAHVAGVYGLEAGLRLASVRGELMGSLPSDAGAMTAVFASAERVEALIEESGAEGVEVAADNGTHRVVSGLVEGVEALEGWCIKAGVRCGRLVTSHAFHSALMEPVLDGIEAAAGDIEVRSPAVSLVSNVTGRVVGEGELLDGAYWRRHARAPVAYGPGVGALSGLGVDVVIELGPGSVLGPLLAQVWPGDDVPVVLASQRRALASGHRDAASGYRDAESADDPGAIVSGGMRAAVSSGEEDGFIEAVAGAWEAGLGLKFEGLHAGEARRRLSLPTYPFERRRYWVEGSGRRHAVGGHPLLGLRHDLSNDGITFDRELSALDPSWLGDHRVFGRIVAPAALHAALATTAIARVAGTVGVAFEGFQIHAPLVFDDADEAHPDHGRRTLQVALGPSGEDGTRSVEIHSRSEEADSWLRHAEGRVVAGSGDDEGGAALDVEALKTELAPTSLASFYEGLAEVGLGYGPLLRVVESVWSGDGESLVEVALPAGEESGDAAATVVLLDGCFQALAAASEAGSEEPWLPFGWDRLWLAGALPERVLCHVRVVEGESASGVRMAELDLYGMDGECIGGVRGFVLKRATRAALLSAVTGVEDLLYDVVWREGALSGGVRGRSFWRRRGWWRAGCGTLRCILVWKGSRPVRRRSFWSTSSGLHGGMRGRRWRGWGGSARRVRWCVRRSCVDR